MLLAYRRIVLRPRIVRPGSLETRTCCARPGMSGHPGDHSFLLARSGDVARSGLSVAALHPRRGLRQARALVPETRNWYLSRRISMGISELLGPYALGLFRSSG